MYAAKFVNVSLIFGGVKAVDNVSFGVEDIGTHAIIGPNGAGKTSLINCLSGVYRPTSGDILVFGKPVSASSPVTLAHAGVARTFQHAELSPDMTVLENAMVGAHRWQGGLRGEPAARQAALEALQAVGLEAHASRLPNELAHGLRKRIELARALAARPRLLLLDEPAAGLTDQEILSLQTLTIELARKIPVIVIAHHMEFVMAVAKTITVLDRGRLIMSGPPCEVKSNDRVREAYLGISAEKAEALSGTQAGEAA